MEAATLETRNERLLGDKISYIQSLECCPLLLGIGFNLTEEELRLNSYREKGIWVASLIELLSGDIAGYPNPRKGCRSVVSDVGYCFIEKDRRHYNEMQNKEWWQRTKDFCRAELGHEPSEDEMYMHYYVKHHNSERYRLWYALMFPDKVRLAENLNAEMIAGLELFSRMATKVSGFDYVSTFGLNEAHKSAAA